MRSAVAVALALLLLTGCPEPVPVKPTVTPPTVSLLLDETNVIGKQVTGKVSTSGCKKVAQVQILQGKGFLADVEYTGNPTTFALPDGLFATLYSKLGIAASLTLTAKVLCDDGRTNNSTPVGARFFPIDTRFKTPSGERVVPDFFVAEGGLAGSAQTFIGCAGTSTGTTIVRTDTSGNILKYVEGMPFDCTLGTQITDLSTSSGYRWIFQEGAGAFSLKMSDFSIGKIFLAAKAKRIGTGPGGIAVVWNDELTTQPVQVRKLSPTSDTSGDWGQAIDEGIMNSVPIVIETGTRPCVWISRFEFNMETRKGDIVPYQYDLFTGAILNGIRLDGNGVPVPAILLSQQFPLTQLNEPIIPQGTFDPNGLSYTLPLPTVDQSGNLQTTIVSCPTAAGKCESTNQRWISQNFPGLINTVVPFSANNIYAVAGQYAVWFLSAQTGQVLNLSEVPIRPSGSQVVVGLLAGAGTDFYVLTAPLFSTGGGYATEIVAVDRPQTGEVWRMNYGSGEATINSVFMSVDAAGTPWLRVGADLVKPLSITDYRTVRGPTVVP